MTPGDIVCLSEGEAGAHQFLNHADESARLLVCSAPVTGPSAEVYPDEEMYVLRVPGQLGIAFASPTSSLITGTASPMPAARNDRRPLRHKLERRSRPLARKSRSYPAAPTRR